jgi:hypothetical protein
MSLGSKGKSNAYNIAVGKAVAAGVTVVVAAGNSADDACQYSPAFAPAAITVGSTTSSDSMSSFSNYGPCIDVFAPGSNILSAGKDSDTHTRELSGTSMACPHVAGAAAILLGSHPSMQPEDVVAALVGQSTRDVVGALPESFVSPNRLLYVTLSTPGPTPAPPPGWSVVMGNCQKTADDCIVSPNFPEVYGSSQSCVIQIGGPVKIGVVSFETEDKYDKLKVNGVSYSGKQGPDCVVATGFITTNTCTNAITNGHAYTAHAESHFIAHASPSPTWLAIAVGSLPRD